MLVTGDMSLVGTITPNRNLAESLQVAFDAGAKRVLLPMFSAVEILTVPIELFVKNTKVLPVSGSLKRIRRKYSGYSLDL